MAFKVIDTTEYWYEVKLNEVDSFHVLIRQAHHEDNTRALIVASKNGSTNDIYYNEILKATVKDWKEVYLPDGKPAPFSTTSLIEQIPLSLKVVIAEEITKELGNSMKIFRGTQPVS